MNDKLIDTFLAEAHELIIDLEKALLVLESDLHNKDGISGIFRSMHTLKGAAGMFGFDEVNTITHHLETIYQDIRDGKRAMNETILRFTFKTLDQLRLLLSDSQENFTESEYDELLQAIKDLAHDNSTAQSSSARADRQTPEKQQTFYISFLPEPATLKNGTNPLYLVDDLLVLGRGVSFPFFHNLPTLEDVVSDNSYIGFEVLLCTDKGEEEVKSVFLFVEDTCSVTVNKIGDDDLLSEIVPNDNPWKVRQELNPIGFEVLQNFIAEKNRKNSGADGLNRSSQARSSNIRVSSKRLDDLMNLVSELVTTQARLALYSNESASPELAAISENIEKITRRLRDNAFTMSLVPMESIVVRFQRLVSDLSKELNKEIEFKAEGMETRIDKSIIEKLTDPILHLLRNSIDHGIESPVERNASGKSSKGMVQLKSYYSGANVIIEISDDGAGLNLGKIREKAVRQNLIESHAHLSEKELTDLIFVPGFSTASAITGVSGRGVGMDVVKRNITDIRGDIEVQTEQGKGTTFKIKLPLTLSILDGLLVKIGRTDFVLPLSSVAKCYEVETHALESTFNNWITLEGRRTPFIYLRKDMGITDNKPTRSQIINVPYNGSYVGLAVDKIEGEYQAVLKPLGHYYQGQEEFSGATILGNGTVALVLDPNKLIRKLTIDNN